MPERRASLMDPKLEDLMDRVDSKFTLVTLAARRAREINAYFNQLGDGLGTIVPPQVTSVSRKPLSIALEEIQADKITYRRPDVEDDAEDVDGAERAFGGFEGDAPADPVDPVDPVSLASVLLGGAAPVTVTHPDPADDAATTLADPPDRSTDVHADAVDAAGRAAQADQVADDTVAGDTVAADADPAAEGEPPGPAEA